MMMMMIMMMLARKFVSLDLYLFPREEVLIGIRVKDGVVILVNNICFDDGLVSGEVP